MAKQVVITISKNFAAPQSMTDFILEFDDGNFWLNS